MSLDQVHQVDQDIKTSPSYFADGLSQTELYNIRHQTTTVDHYCTTMCMSSLFLLSLLLYPSSAQPQPQQTHQNHNLCQKCDLLRMSSSTPFHLDKFLKHHDSRDRAHDHGENLWQHDKDGTTVLFLAARNNLTSLVHYLLSYIDDDDDPLPPGYLDAAPYESGATPLFISIQQGNLPITLLLLRHKANSTKPTRTGVTPLHAAAFSGREGFLKPLLVSSNLVRNAINEPSPITGHSALHMAIATGSLPNVQALLTYDGGFANCNVRVNIVGASPLWYACASGNFPMVQYLLNTCSGIDIDTGDSQHWTPFMVAARLGHVDILQTLLQHKTNSVARIEYLNQKSKHQTALIIAVTEQQVETVRFLLAQHKINAGQCVQGGWNALIVACELGSVDIVTLLLQARANHGPLAVSRMNEVREEMLRDNCNWKINV